MIFDKAEAIGSPFAFSVTIFIYLKPLELLLPKLPYEIFLFCFLLFCFLLFCFAFGLFRFVWLMSHGGGLRLGILGNYANVSISIK